MKRIFLALVLASLTISACDMGGTWPSESTDQPVQSSSPALQTRASAGYRVPSYMNFDSTYTNTFLGYLAGRLTTGSHNVGVGWKVLYNNISGYNNTAIGDEALLSNVSGWNNTASGFAALLTNSTGHDNTANGYFALAVNTSGYFNVADGSNSLSSNTTGWGNTANGFNALSGNTTGSLNNAFGYQALFTNNGSNNDAFGTNSLANNTTGGYNVAFGGRSLLGNTTGGDNTAAGYGALGGNSSGNNNTAVGFSALAYNITGMGNTAVGISAGNNYGGVLNTANTWCTFIGDYTSSSVDGVTNSSAIGYNAVVTKSNQMVLGNNQVKETLLHGATSVDGIAVCLANGTGCPSTVSQSVWVSGSMVDGAEIACPSGTHGSTWKFSNSGGVMTMSVLCN